MGEKMIFIADMEYFKAFKVSTADTSKKYSIELLTSFVNIVPHKKFHEMVTDRAGHFTMKTAQGAGASGSGEQHNIFLENRKRAVKHIADNIAGILKKSGINRWYLAAPKKINHEIIDCMDPALKTTLVRNVCRDLTKDSSEKLLARFMN